MEELQKDFSDFFIILHYIFITHYFNVGSELVLISGRGVCAGSQHLCAGKDQSKKIWYVDIWF